MSDFLILGWTSTVWPPKNNGVHCDYTSGLYWVADCYRILLRTSHDLRTTKLAALSPCSPTWCLTLTRRLASFPCEPFPLPLGRIGLTEEMKLRMFLWLQPQWKKVRIADTTLHQPGPHHSGSMHTEVNTVKETYSGALCQRETQQELAGLVNANHLWNFWLTSLWMFEDICSWY